MNCFLCFHCLCLSAQKRDYFFVLKLSAKISQVFGNCMPMIFDLNSETNTTNDITIIRMPATICSLSVCVHFYFTWNLINTLNNNNKKNNNNIIAPMTNEFLRNYNIFKLWQHSTKFFEVVGCCLVVIHFTAQVGKVWIIWKKKNK